MKQTEFKPKESKPCKDCKEDFKPFSTLQKRCLKCSIEHGNSIKKKTNRKELREYREKNKSRSDRVKEAQTAFNAFIRAKDKNKPCISCGCFTNDYDLLTGSRWDAGHYRSVGSAPELRFSELNCHKQCVKCNRNLSGNIVEYRINLKTRISESELNWLEGHHQPQKWTIDDLIEIKLYFKEKLKLIQQ